MIQVILVINAEIGGVWLEAQFDGAERNVRRLAKVQELEEKNFK